MSAKRFIQLFVCYFASIVVAILLANVFPITNHWVYMLVVSIIGYIVLTVPLTIMTVMKKK